MKQPDLLAKAVRAEAPATEAQMLLSITLTDPFEFDNGMPPTAVVGINGKNGNGFGITPNKLGMPAAQAVEQPVKVGSRVNRKRRRHAF